VAELVPGISLREGGGTIRDEISTEKGGLFLYGVVREVDPDLGEQIVILHHQLWRGKRCRSIHMKEGGGKSEIAIIKAESVHVMTLPLMWSRWQGRFSLIISMRRLFC